MSDLLPPSQNQLLSDLVAIIKQGKQQAVQTVNSTMTLVYWHVGKRINDDVLQNERAEYGKEVINSLAANLQRKYGKSFQARNMCRMMQFANLFTDIAIVSPLATQLSWTHFVILLPLKNQEARLFYAQKSIEGNWSKRELSHQIERKAFERNEISEIQNTELELTTSQTFKDPYFLDFLDLKSGYSENDLESAIQRELEQFILELGMGFTFVERQKRIILDGHDFYIDLLFFHRKLKRLVAFELKIGAFKAAHKGQMELYLKWLYRHDKQEGENPPIGLILCTEASREQVELLQMHKDGILVAEYWTELPPKKLLEERLHKALIEARDQLERKRLLE